MASIVSGAIHNAKQKASSLSSVMSTLQNNPVFGGGIGFPTIFSSITGAAGSVNNVNMTVHQEQYRHYTGWVYSSIRAIANAIASQPIHVARVPKIPYMKSTLNVSKGDPRERSVKGASQREKIYTPNGVFDKEYALRQMWFKQVLPKSQKSYYDAAELVPNHPILDALRKPNPITNFFTLLFQTSASIELTGKAHWWIDISPENQYPIQIWYMPSHWVEPVHLPGRIFAAWKITPEGTGIPFYVPREHVIYFPNPDPSNPFTTFSTLTSQAKAVVSDESIAEAQYQSFKRGIFPGYGIVLGDVFDEDGINKGRPELRKNQRMQIIEAFRRMYQGVYNFDEPIILDKLISDVKKLTNMPAEMGFMESGKITKEKITQAYGVNPIVMGHIEGANRASSIMAKENLYDVAVNPRISLISEVLSAWFTELFSGPEEELVLFLEECGADDPEQNRMNVEVLLKYGCCTRNEARAVLKMAPKDGMENTFVPETMKLIAPMCSEQEFNAIVDRKPAQNPLPSTVDLGVHDISTTPTDVSSDGPVVDLPDSMPVPDQGTQPVSN